MQRRRPWQRRRLQMVMDDAIDLVPHDTDEESLLLDEASQASRLSAALVAQQAATSRSSTRPRVRSLPRAAFSCYLLLFLPPRLQTKIAFSRSPSCLPVDDAESCPSVAAI